MRWLATRFDAQLCPPNVTGMPEPTYQRVITGPTFGLGMLRNATPQRRLWQRFWLELLSNAGARCVSAPGGESA